MTAWIGLLVSCVAAIVGVLMAFDWSTVIANPTTVGIITAVLTAVSAVVHYFQTPAKS